MNVLDGIHDLWGKERGALVRLATAIVLGWFGLLAPKDAEADCNGSFWVRNEYSTSCPGCNDCPPQNTSCDPFYDAYDCATGQFKGFQFCFCASEGPPNGCGDECAYSTEVCDGLDNDRNGQTDENGACQNEPRPPDKCEDRRLVDDPIDIASGAVFLSRPDFSVNGRANFTFTRSYSSNNKVFKLGFGTRTRPLWGVPKPFGADPRYPDLVKWWHSLFSFVGDYKSPYVFAFDLEGRMRLFES